MKQETKEIIDEHYYEQPIPMTLRIEAYAHSGIPTKPTLQANESYIGETIEQRVEKILNNNEPITDGAPQIYTERSQGVIQEYNIRADRFEMAIDATEQITKNRLAERQANYEKRQPPKTETTKPETTSTPTPGTSTTTK